MDVFIFRVREHFPGLMNRRKIATGNYKTSPIKTSNTGMKDFISEKPEKRGKTVTGHFFAFFSLCLVIHFCALFGLGLPPVPIQVKPSGVKEQRILQIQELIQQGNQTEAKRVLTQAMKEFPADSGFDNLLGIIEAQGKNYQGAEMAFRRAITRSPLFTGAYLNLGKLYQENSAVDPQALAKALRVYQKILQYQPDHGEANYQCAVLLQLRGDYKLSLDHLSRLPVDLQRSAQALSVSSADYAGIGNLARATEMIHLLSNHPDLSEADVNSILPVLVKAELYGPTIALIKGLVGRGIGSPELLHQLGLLYERAGQFDLARATLERSVTQDRYLAGRLVDLSRVAHKQKDYKGALGYLAHARDLEPQNAKIHYFFGMVCVDLNLGAEAHAALGKAVSLDPENPQYNFAMGFVSLYRHNSEDAVPYLEKYFQLKPGDPRGKLMLGMAYFRGKNFGAARKALLEVVGNQETGAPVHYYLGSIARQENRIEEAVQELEKSLQLRPDYVDALAELGQCRLQQKDYQSSEKLLRRALEINPDHYAANFNLLTLYSRMKDPRAEEQSRKFEEIKKLREEKSQEFLRGIEFRPY
jgi:tetratricopeptide (TPR) repeat protein